MQEVNNPFQALNNIFFKPNGVFRTLAHVNNWSWIPFLLLVGSSFMSIYVYFNFIDFSWYTEMLVNQTMADNSPAEKDMFRNNMSKEAALYGGGIMVFLGPVIVNAILAVYLNAMTKHDETNTNGFSDWYGLTWWAQVPAVLNALIAMLILLVSSDHQVMPSVLGPLSLAYILAIDMASPWFNFLSSVRIDLFWTVYLFTVGISQWTSFDSRKSLIIASAPFVIIYGLWALFTIF